MQQPSGWQYDSSRRDYYYFDPADNCYVYQNQGRVPSSEQNHNAQYVLTKVDGGTPEQITEPRAFQSGIRAHKRIKGRTGDTERLNLRYVRRYPGRDFYKIGKVFKVLWPEPTENPHSGATFVTGAFNEPTYNKIRWFVVIREGKDCCTCLSIQTYNRQGVAKPGVDKAEHSVVYTDSQPQVPEWEDPYGEMLQAIPIVANDPSQAKMDAMSRLNYAKPYTVEHNVKSLEFGDVAPGWTHTLRDNFLTVLQRDPSGSNSNTALPPPHAASHQQTPDEGTCPPQKDHSLEAYSNEAWTYPSSESNATLTHDKVVAYNQARSERPCRPSADNEIYGGGFDPSESRQPEVPPQSTALPVSSDQELPDEVSPPSVQGDQAQGKGVMTDAEGRDRGQAHSDSGYHSGKGTDTASVCSIESSGGSLGIPTNFLQDFITFFGNNLIAKAGMHAWAPYAVAEHEPAGIEAHLDHLLKQYVVDLEELASGQGSAVHETALAGFDYSIAKDAIRLIRRYRPKIARYFRQNALSTVDPNALTLSRIQGYGIRLSLDERVSLFDKLQTSELDEDSETDEDDDDDLNLNAVKDFLLAGQPFKRLMTAMRRDLYCDDQSQMRRIQDIVTNTIIAAGNEPCSKCVRGTHNGGTTESADGRCRSMETSYRTSFSIDWDPVEFLQSQYDDQRTILGSVLVLSGSGLYAHATTCADYIQSVWPNTCNVLLPLLHESFDKSATHRQLEDGGSIMIRLQTGWLKKRKHNSLRIELDATVGFTVEIAQQISWLAAALRVGLSETAVSYSEASITQKTSSEPELTNFHISIAQRPLDPTETSCWFSLFSSAGIAHGFPIPERESEPGLEIPIDILAALAGVRHAVEFQGGVVLKGFSTMFVPTERDRDGVRWHFIRNGDGKFLSYQDGVQKCPTRLMVDEVDLHALQATKTFVGWCSAAKLFLGSEDINYANLHYSGYHLEKLGSHLNVAGGSVGFSQFATAQLNVTFGAKDGKCHFQRNSGPYNEIIAMAEDSKVLLYDTCDRRAWLVPASNTILHIAQARHQTGFLGVDKGQVKLFSKDTSECSARETLVRDASNMIVACDGYRLKELVLDIWSLLDYLTAHKEPNDATPGIEAAINFQDKLHGFEFGDVVRKRSPCELQRCSIAKTNGGWVDLVRDIGALTLFANGFEDLIKPSDACQDLCRHWHSLPKGRDYLAVTVRMLKDLYEVAGCPLDRKFLSSSRLRWHQSCSIFGPCEARIGHHCGCSRLSQVLGKHYAGTVNGPGSLGPYDEGAVIFGQSRTFLDNIFSQKESQRQGLYSHENQDISGRQTANNSGLSESSNSDGGSSIQNSNVSGWSTDSSVSTVLFEHHIVHLLEEKSLEEKFRVEKPTPAADPEQCRLQSLSLEDDQPEEHLAHQVTFNRESTGTEPQTHSMFSLSSNEAPHASDSTLHTPKAPLVSLQPQATKVAVHGLRRKHGQGDLGIGSKKATRQRA